MPQQAAPSPSSSHGGVLAVALILLALLGGGLAVWLWSAPAEPGSQQAGSPQLEPVAGRDGAEVTETGAGAGAGTGGGAPLGPSPQATGTTRFLDQPKGKPNIVLVLTDDLSWNLVKYMPQVQRLQREGATFERFFVSNSLCCPSRATLLTGQYPHNNGVVRNTYPDGGWKSYQGKPEDNSFAPQLQKQGYRTALVGKFLNGWRAQLHRPVRGWDYWFASSLAYKNYDYRMREYDLELEQAQARKQQASRRREAMGRQSLPNQKQEPQGRPGVPGRVLSFGTRPQDYVVDVIARRGRAWIARQPKRPFFIKLSTFTPHAPATPAPRHLQRYGSEPLPRTPAYNAENANPPRWLALHKPLGGSKLRRINSEWTRRVRSVLAIDEMMAQIRRTLRAKGLERNTYIVFTSDNGYHLGEHQLIAGKRTAFDHDIRVPLIVAGPGIKPGLSLQQTAINIDLAPTFLRMAGLKPPSSMDGRSLLPLMQGDSPQWRDNALIEYVRPFRPNDPLQFDSDASDWFTSSPPSYLALRTPHGLYVEYETGETEYYDHQQDPYELRNRAAELTPQEQSALHEALLRMVRCRGQASCEAAAMGSKRLIPQLPDLRQQLGQLPEQEGIEDPQQGNPDISGQQPGPDPDPATPSQPKVENG